MSSVFYKIPTEKKDTTSLTKKGVKNAIRKYKKIYACCFIVQVLLTLTIIYFSITFFLMNTTNYELISKQLNKKSYFNFIPDIFLLTAVIIIQTIILIYDQYYGNEEVNNSKLNSKLIFILTAIMIIMMSPPLLNLIF